METLKDLPVLEFVTYKSWIDWLTLHHTQRTGIWIKCAKKGSGIITLTYEEAREGALRFGWIDGQRQKYDETYYLLHFKHRNPKSIWSKINRDIVDDLMQHNLLFPEGISEVDAAKRDGRWEQAYASQATISVPDDFQHALSKSPTAEANFQSISKSNRYAFLFRIHTAKREETRTRLIARFIEMLEVGEKFH